MKTEPKKSKVGNINIFRPIGNDLETNLQQLLEIANSRNDTFYMDADPNLVCAKPGIKMEHLRKQSATGSLKSSMEKYEWRMINDLTSELTLRDGIINSLYYELKNANQSHQELFELSLKLTQTLQTIATYETLLGNKINFIYQKE